MEEGVLQVGGPIWKKDVKIDIIFPEEMRYFLENVGEQTTLTVRGF